MVVAKRTLVLGLGNELLRDDGVGLCAARRVAYLVQPRADLAEACVATVDLLQVMRGYDRVIVVDAYLSQTDPPGTAVRCGPDDLPRGFGYRSFHTLPFREMLDLGREVGLPMPRMISIHGLSVADPASFGQSFTPAVERAWRLWADEIARQEFGDPQAFSEARSHAVHRD
jgi:hydrogenase maturation protease